VTQDQSRHIPRWLVLLGFFAFGCAAALGQILLLREFLVTFHGTEICVGAFYGSWFLWIALGAWWGPRLLARWLSDESAYLVLHLALPVAVLVEIVLLRSLRSGLGVAPETLLPLETLLLSSMLLTAPAGAVIGALFPITGRLLAGAGRDPISLGYAWESAGSLAGGVAFTYLFATRFDPLVTLAAMGLLEGFTVLVVAARAGQRRALVAAVVGCLAYGSLLTPVGTALDRATERIRWRSLQRGYELVAVRHTPYSHVAVGRDASGQYGIFYDGIQRTIFPDVPTFRQEAALAMAQHPGARRVLVLGGGSEGLVQQLLAYPVERIDCLEDDPWALALVKRYLKPRARAALDDPRVRILTQDGRLYINHRAHGRRYDLVISRASDPTTASMNRYFTQEFFRGVKRVLRPGGAVIVHTVDTRAYAGDSALKTAGSVLRTLKSVFAHVQLVAHRGNLFAASTAAGRVSPDPTLLASRHRAIPMDDAALMADKLQGAISLERSRSLRRQLDLTGGALNTDSRPTTYFHAIQLWGRRSGSEMPAVFAALERAGVWFFVILLLVLGVARLAYRLTVPNPERSQRTNTAIAIGVTGFAAMALQIMILMGFQSHLGSLYQKVGLLTGAFMMGLAGGALAGRVLAGRVRSPRLILALALAVLAVFSLAVPMTIGWLGAYGNGYVAAVYFGMSLSAGVITGCLFPLSVVTYDPQERDVGRTAAVMDAADHIGASLGGLLAGTLIVPIVGQHATAQVVALAAVVPAVLLGLDWLLARRGWRMKPSATRRLSFPWIRASWIMGSVVVAVLACSALVRCRPPAEDPATVRKPFPHQPYFGAVETGDKRTGEKKKIARPRSQNPSL
jgi:predicted membrane-bound spermidine synthase